jgi:lambda family phage portal protein
MNIVDKAVAYFNPEAGMRRVAAKKTMQILNSGYSEGGASTQKKSMKGWRADSVDAEEDIDLNLDILRVRSRDLFMNAPLARAAINTTRTNVVGSGLKLKARIDSEFLGLTEAQAAEFEQSVEREFALWAESIHCDALKLNNFYELQTLAQVAWLQSGDTFALLKMRTEPFMPYDLRVHIIEADRVITPSTTIDGTAYSIAAIEGKAPNGNRIVSGVEMDKHGAVAAYWIAKRHPKSRINLTVNDCVRVEAFGKLTGRPNVLHLMESERPEQRRGVPFLAPIVEELKQLTRYTEAELMAAVISSYFTVFIKTNDSPTEVPFGQMIPEEQQVESDTERYYEMGVGAVNVLGPNEEIQIANPTRPNTAFEQFTGAMARYIGAALEIPQELLEKHFQSSYSASRAALLEGWKMFKMRRSWFANDFCQPIYETWFTEAVAKGRIKAPKYFDDPIYQKAWTRADWNGPAQGQVDPKKEVEASVIRINNGLSTRERETIELTGGDFDRNIKQLARESELMRGVNPIEQKVLEPNNE